MTEYIHYFNLILGIFAIILQGLCFFALILLFLVPNDNKFKNKVLSLFSENFLLIGFLISFFAVALSLFYSEVIGYTACSLCWWQRIFMFPQLVLFGVAYLKRDTKIGNYAFPLLLIGFLFAVYNNYIYYFNPNLNPCDASGVSCIQRFVSEFGGYISIPTLSLTVFFALITLLLINRFYNNRYQS